MYKNAEIWAPQVIKNSFRNIWRRHHEIGLKHILFCVADHFEPGWNKADRITMRGRVRIWGDQYPRLAERHRDSNGRPAQHTWFYAVEEYEPFCVEVLKGMCDRGYGEIELHLHHENDSPEGLREKLENAKKDFSRHGSFVTCKDPPRYAFGFIHGNWALNNSRYENLCGVDNELKILRDAGCYADFTLPSAPHESQTSKINSIYYAIDIPGMRKSHNDGIDVRAGVKNTGDMLLIQGPLALNWKRRKYGFLPTIENSVVHKNHPATPDRVRLWIDQKIHILGRPEWIFVKIHCHGTQEDDRDVILGEGAEEMYRSLEECFNDGKKYMLHYVTAREMFNIVKAGEDGKKGNPFQYRNYIIPPYIRSGSVYEK